MPQLLLPGMPGGAIRINPVLSRLSKDGRMTWFVGTDNYFSHLADDSAGHRLAIATLMANGHARCCQIQKALSIAPRSLVRWRKQLDTRGAASFYQPRSVRGAAVLTAETAAKCQALLDQGHPIASVARLANIKDSTLRKAIAAGRLIKPATPHPTAAPTAAAPSAAAPSSKSQRSRTDARAAEAIGTACTRADERTAAAFGLARSATTRFESATDLALGGVLCGLPGTGKSTLIKSWLAGLEPKRFLPLLITQSSLSATGVLEVLLAKLGERARFKRSTNLLLLEKHLAEIEPLSLVLVLGVAGDIRPRQEVTLRIHRTDGSTTDQPVILCIDTPIEIEYCRHGGILPFVLRQILALSA